MDSKRHAELGTKVRLKIIDKHAEALRLLQEANILEEAWELQDTAALVTHGALTPEEAEELKKLGAK